MAGGQLPQLIADGEAAPVTDFGKMYTPRVYQKNYGHAHLITRDALRFNKYPQLALDGASRLIADVMELYDQVHFNVLNDAFTVELHLDPAGNTTGDGKTLCATDHPLRDGTTMANTPSVATDLNEAGLDGAWIAIRNYKGYNGRLIDIKPNMVVMSPTNRFNAARLLLSDMRPVDASNAVNAIRTEGMFPGGRMDSVRITAAKSWFIINDLPDANTGLISVVSQAPIVTVEEPTDRTGNKALVSFTSFAATCLDYRGVHGSPGI